MWDFIAKRLNKWANTISQLASQPQRWLTASTLVLILIGYGIYALLVLRPSQFHYFSLIDDGQTLQNSQTFRQCLLGHNCQPLSTVIFEKQFGRFRPGYWLIQAILYQSIGLHPQAFHVIRALVIGGVLVVLLNLVILSAKGTRIAMILGSAIFVTSYAFSENLIRLGPVEPFQAAFLALFSLLFFYKHSLSKKLPSWLIQLAITLSLLIMCSIKETSIAIFPVLILVFPQQIQKSRWWEKCLLFFPVLILFLGKFLARPNPGQTNYIENYQVSITGILQMAGNYWTLLAQTLFPFFWLVILGAAVFLFIWKSKLQLQKNQLLYWILVCFFFTVILFPWKYLLERYLFISVFSFAVIASTIIGETVTIIGQKLSQDFTPNWKYLFYPIICTLLLTNMFTQYLPYHLAKSLNYSQWYATFLTFEHDEVTQISKLPELPVINAVQTLDNWEVLYELPIHLQYFHQRQVELALIDSKQPLTSLYIFSSSSLQPALNSSLNPPAGYSLYQSATYQTLQFDIPRFSEDFHYRPVQAFLKPSLGSPITHQWQIWQKVDLKNHD